MWFWYDMNDMCDIVYTYAPTQSQHFCSTIQFIWLLLDAWFSIFKLNSSTSGMNACCTLTRESLLLQLQNFITMSSCLPLGMDVVMGRIVMHTPPMNELWWMAELSCEKEKENMWTGKLSSRGKSYCEIGRRNGIFEREKKSKIKSTSELTFKLCIDF